MIKKSLALVLATMLLGSQVSADAVVDSVAAVAANVQEESFLDLTPQTVSQEEFFAAGENAMKAALEANPNLTEAEALQVVEAAYGTVALRNSEKAIWFAIGAAAAVIGYFAVTFIHKTFFAKEEPKKTPAPAPVAVAAPAAVIVA